MSDKNKPEEKLPDGWVLCQSKSNAGRKYYFNKKTGKSSWTWPLVDNNAVKYKKNRKRPKKKDKVRQPEKIPTQEVVQRNNLKRKSDHDEAGSAIKKIKETPTPEKPGASCSKKPSPKKLNNIVCHTEISEQSTSKECSTDPAKLPKNLANSRLAKLRAQLASEIQNEEVTQQASKRKFGPNQSETRTKIPKTEGRNTNESKCVTSTQSPSESLQSDASPSLFLALNKSICSMKAQLPENNYDKSKLKDTYADIEKGIFSQHAEYTTKHPSTPPQFSEASQLVSAMKSKLSYKIPMHQNSANDRLEALRANLSTESLEDTNDSFLKIRSRNTAVEAMEVEEIKQSSPTLTGAKDGDKKPKEEFVIVVDTNIFIHELNVIKTVLNSHIRGYKSKPMVMVPWRVINELDRLKSFNDGKGALCWRARAAMDYLHQRVPDDNNRLICQTLRDHCSHIYPCELPDDEILNCCLQQLDKAHTVILLSNDKNLCSKAVINGIKKLTINELRDLLDETYETADPNSCTAVNRYEDAMCSLLANILESEMKVKYGNLWLHVVFIKPPWSLGDVLQCLLKHWIAVFSDVFPRIQDLLTDLKNALNSIHAKGLNSLCQSEVMNFKELCLNIAIKCQIIPEYMQLAKATVEKLQSETNVAGDAGQSGMANDVLIRDEFESLWTVFSSYCTKLSARLGLTNNIEDQSQKPCTLENLIGNLSSYSNQMLAVIEAISNILNIQSIDDPSIDNKVSNMDAVLKDSFVVISKNRNDVSIDDLRIFCTSQQGREMLQKVYEMFIQLTEKLEVCKNQLMN